MDSSIIVFLFFGVAAVAFNYFFYWRKGAPFDIPKIVDQTYALLSKELTKENYNEDIDTLAYKAS